MQKCFDEKCDQYSERYANNCRAVNDTERCDQVKREPMQPTSSVPLDKIVSVPKSVIDRTFEACWNATSKLESQVMRSSELPEGYHAMVTESFAALRELMSKAH